VTVPAWVAVIAAADTLFAAAIAFILEASINGTKSSIILVFIIIEFYNFLKVDTDYINGKAINQASL
jgi:hypothetical protein